MKLKKYALIGLALMLALPAFGKTSKTPSKAATNAQRQSARKEIIRSLIVQGTSSLRHQQYSNAISLFQKAAKLDPHSAEAAFDLGQAYYYRAFQRGGADKADLDDARSAIAAYEKVKKLDPKLHSISSPYLIYHELAMCDEAVKNHRAALVALGLAMRLAPRNPMPALYSAQVRYAMGDAAGSNQDLETGFHRAQEIRGSAALAKLIRKDASFSRLLLAPQNRDTVDSYDQADRGRLSATLAMNPANTTIYYRDSLASLPRGKIPQPIAPFRDPKVVAQLRQAETDYKFDRFREAIIEYRQALNENARTGTINPIEKSIIMEKIGTAYRRLGLTRESIAVLEQSTREMPQNPSAFYQLALAYSLSGKFSKALKALDEALRTAISPSDHRRFLLLAKTDKELDPLRDLPAFWKTLKSHSELFHS